MQNEKARGFIISGFPRDSIDLTTYLERVGRVDGVILLNWHESAILTQIDFGAKQGMVDLDDANTELLHFKKEGIPVAEYFDYKQQLYVVRNLFRKIYYCQYDFKITNAQWENQAFFCRSDFAWNQVFETLNLPMLISREIWMVD